MVVHHLRLIVSRLGFIFLLVSYNIIILCKPVEGCITSCDLELRLCPHLHYAEVYYSITINVNDSVNGVIVYIIIARSNTHFWRIHFQTLVCLVPTG